MVPDRLKTGVQKRAKAVRDTVRMADRVHSAHYDRGQVGFQTVLAVVSVFVLGMVAVVVADNLDQSIGTPSNTALSTAQNDIITGFGDMSSLLGTLFIIAIVVVIIFQIRRVQ